MRTWRALFVTSAVASLTLTAIVLFGPESRSARGEPVSGIAVVPGATPSPSLDFSIGIDVDHDGVDDCNTSGGPTSCHLPLGIFALDVYLNSLPDGATNYAAVDIFVEYFGVTSQNNPSMRSWPDCGLEAQANTYTFMQFACVANFGEPSTYLGRIATADFDCAASGTVGLSHGEGKTDLVVDIGRVYQERNGVESLTILCGDPPIPPPPPDLHGDADCDGSITSLDALTIFQFVAHLTSSLPCVRNADVRKLGEISSIDAQLCLEFAAGLIDRMPQPF